MALRPAVKELPGVPFSALSGDVGYAPGDFVDLEIIAVQYVLPQGLIEGLEPGGYGMHPVVDCGGRKLHSKVGVLLYLPVFGEMVAVFVYYNLREHVRPDMVAADDCLRCRCLIDFRIRSAFVGLCPKYGALEYLHPHFRRFTVQYADDILPDYIAIINVYAFGHQHSDALLESGIAVPGRP